MNAGRSLVAGLEIGRVVRIIHEVAGGLRIRPFKDHAQGCGLVFALDLFVAGCARNILAAMFGDDLADRLDIAGDPAVVGGCHGQN